MFNFRLFVISAGVLMSSYTNAEQCSGLLNHEFYQLGQDDPVSLCDFQDNVVMVVNTASQCGFTPQFENLESVYREYKDRGFVVLGFPSNDFSQEPGNHEQIKSFCETNYDVTFPMFEKIKVKGNYAHPFYKDLSRAANSTPKWNFHKYLIGKNGRMIDHYLSWTKPDSKKVKRAIERALNE